MNYSRIEIFGVGEGGRVYKRNKKKWVIWKLYLELFKDCIKLVFVSFVFF